MDNNDFPDKVIIAWSGGLRMSTLEVYKELYADIPHQKYVKDLQQPCVDVEALHKDFFYNCWGKPKNAEEAAKLKTLPNYPNGMRQERDRCYGWNECLDHLSQQGHLTKTVDEWRDKPIPIVINCPECNTVHVDEDEWKERPHKTHECQCCRHTWRPCNFATVGVFTLPTAPKVEVE